MRILPITLPDFKVLRMLTLLGLSQLALLAQAQTFKIDCDAEASIPQLDNKKLAPAKITLTTATRLGANKKNRANGRQNQITIERDSVAYAGYNDTDYQGKSVRILFEGKCKLPRP
jgi:hypothetical protein